jgi:hypothetical protein
MRFALLALGLLGTPAFADPSLQDAASGLDLFPCALSSLSCATLTVPLDHRANDPAQTLDITFALSFASNESKGILFYFVGGPGGSGLASTDGYLSAFDPSLTENIDIVFVDQRGTGPAHGLSCPTAQARFDIAPAPLSDPDAILATAKSYVTDCTAELDADALLRRRQHRPGDPRFRSVPPEDRRAEGLALRRKLRHADWCRPMPPSFPRPCKGVIRGRRHRPDPLLRRILPPLHACFAEQLLTETFASCADHPRLQGRHSRRSAAQVYDDLAARARHSADSGQLHPRGRLARFRAS